MFPMLFNGEGRLRSGWKILAFLVALSAANGLVYLLLVQAMGLRALARGPAGELIPTLILVAVSWAALSLEGRPLKSLGLRLDLRWARELALGLLAGGALILLSALLLRALGGFTWTSNPLAKAQTLLGGCWVFLFVAINEEATFRGYPFQRLVEGLGPWGAQAVFAGFFALVHWGNPGIRDANLPLKAVATINIALAAILLGLAFLRTRSLALPIGIHWAWNWTQGNVLGFAVSGTGDPIAPIKPVLAARPHWLTGGAVGLEGSVACTFVCLGFILVLCFWRGSAPREA